MASTVEPTGNGGILGGGRVPPKERLVIGRGSGGRRRAADERGQALVEFVLLLPIFLMLVFGMIEFGRAFNYWIDMTHLANEGARYAAVNRWPGCPSNDLSACTAPAQLREYIQQRANTEGLGNRLTFKPVPDGTSPNALDAGGDSIVICFPEGGTPEPGEAVRVVVRTTYEIGVVNGLLGALGLKEVGTIDLTGAATIRLERAPTGNRVLAEDSPTCPT